MYKLFNVVKLNNKADMLNQLQVYKFVTLYIRSKRSIINKIQANQENTIKPMGFFW